MTSITRKKRQRSLKVGKKARDNKMKRQKTHHFPKCPVCQEQMIGVKIILCDNGHSQCETCQLQQDKCPTCRVPYDHDQLTRNYDLEKMIQSFETETISCKFGCTATLTVKDATKHYEKCARRLVRCPLSNCERLFKNFRGQSDESFGYPSETEFEPHVRHGWELSTNCPMVPLYELKEHIVDEHYLSPSLDELTYRTNFPSFRSFAFNPLDDDNCIKFFNYFTRTGSAFAFAIAFNRTCTMIDVFTFNKSVPFVLTIRQGDCDFSSPSTGLLLSASAQSRSIHDFKHYFTEHECKSTIRLHPSNFGEDTDKTCYLDIKFI